jgi:hypothetical protein
VLGAVDKAAVEAKRLAALERQKRAAAAGGAAASADAAR